MARLGEDPVRPLSAKGPRCGAVSAGLSSAGLSSGRARALIVRVCACAWFLVLGAASLNAVGGLIADIAAGRAGPGVWPALLSAACLGLFYATICCLILLRPEPVSRADGLGSALLALAGCYGGCLIVLLPRGPELPPLVAASAAILVFSEVLMIYTLLALGRSFSVIPQARKLVTSGPYAIVRHPLYLVEETAIAGVLLQYDWFAALPFLVLHLAVQIGRMQREEEVLQKAFPEYAAYAQRTPRLLPGVW
jgi:protein-S-isoprenylcysteine O-methyltransferase Ste14